MSLKKKLIVIFLMLLIIPTGLIIYSMFDYWSMSWCWQCGARQDSRHFVETVKESPWADEVATILGHPCRHEHWEVDSTAGGFPTFFGDRFAHRYVPMVADEPGPGFIIAAIKLLPTPEWRRHVLLAIGNPDNGAKWVAVAALTTLSPELEWWGPPKAPEDWNIWWLTNEKYFVTVTDKRQALALAEEFSRANNPPGQDDFIFENEMGRDLRRLGEE